MIDGLIFDKDGVIFESERVYQRALDETLAQFGIELPEQALRRFIGLDAHACRTLLAQLLPEAVSVETVQQAWLVRHAEIVANEGVPFVAGVEQCIEAAYAAGLTLALVTSDSLDGVLADFAMTRPELLSLFSVVITLDDVVNPKPNPEPYLRAQALLNLPANRLLVIEDSEHGARAALAADLPVVLLSSTESVKQALEAEVACVVETHQQWWARFAKDF